MAEHPKAQPVARPGTVPNPSGKGGKLSAAARPYGEAAVETIAESMLAGGETGLRAAEMIVRLAQGRPL